jgi:hypothetical protein
MLKFRFTGGHVVVTGPPTRKKPADNRTPVRVSVKVQSTGGNSVVNPSQLKTETF